jgi:Cu-processing system ATP-binding protein
MAIVQLQQVTKIFNQVTALNGLNLTLEEGEVLGLLGHNGAGKTTTMKLILGLIPVSSGQLHVFAQNPYAEKAQQTQKLRLKIGYLPETIQFYEQLTGEEVLQYFAKLKMLNPALCGALLEQVGLTFAAKRRVKTYSKGMRQRLGLAQALLGKPRLLLLDEPTVGLDPSATRDFYQTLDQLRQQGVSIILCSHILAGIEQHIDRVVILGQGQQLAEGTLDELREQSQLPLTIKIKGSWSDDTTIDTQLAKQAINIEHISPTRIELTTKITNKMALMRSLLDDPHIIDIDTYPPMLDDIYAHFTHQSP